MKIKVTERLKKGITIEYGKITKAFTLKWIELINQYEKNKGKATPAR